MLNLSSCILKLEVWEKILRVFILCTVCSVHWEKEREWESQTTDREHKFVTVCVGVFDLKSEWLTSNSRRLWDSYLLSYVWPTKSFNIFLKFQLAEVFIVNFLFTCLFFKLSKISVRSSNCLFIGQSFLALSQHRLNCSNTYNLQYKHFLWLWGIPNVTECGMRHRRWLKLHAKQKQAKNIKQEMENLLFSRITQD